MQSMKFRLLYVTTLCSTLRQYVSLAVKRVNGHIIERDLKLTHSTGNKLREYQGSERVKSNDHQMAIFIPAIGHRSDRT